jgi:hypothetical protein
MARPTELAKRHGSVSFDLALGHDVGLTMPSSFRLSATRRIHRDDHRDELASGSVSWMARGVRRAVACGLACTSAIHRPFQLLGPATLGHQGGDLINRGVDRDTPILGPTLPAELLEEPLPIRAIVQQAVCVDADHVALPPTEPVREPV